MLANLLDAIKELELSIQLDKIDVDGLPVQDYRTGYGTPTILLNSKDLFGMPKPDPAAPT